MLEAIGGISHLMFNKVVLGFGPTAIIIALIWNAMRGGDVRGFFKRLLWAFGIAAAGWLLLLGGVMAIFFNAYY